MFTLDRLKVYEKALVLSATAEVFTASWARRHAIVDHYRRASESIVLNIAEGSRLRSGPEKARTLDYALGSTLECGGCLDLATIKGFLTQECSVTQKKAFLEITRMLVGLRKSWLKSVLNEEPSSYPVEPSTPNSEALFHHETLDVYQIGLEFMRWFVGLPGGRELSDRLCREIDKSATSLVLNVAEGNGRYSEIDHRRFLEIAAGSAVKAAVYLDIYQQKALPARLETNQGRELLNRIIAMLNQF